MWLLAVNIYKLYTCVCVCVGYCIGGYTYVYMRDLYMGITQLFNCMTSTLRPLHVNECFLALPGLPKYMFPSIAIDTKPPRGS